MHHIYVHLLHEPDDEAKQHLEHAVVSQIQLSYGPITEVTPDFHILIAGRPTEADLKASSRLQHLIIPWAGLPQRTREVMAKFPDISIHNLHHNAIPAAEMAISLLMAASKFIVPMDWALRQGDWRPRYNPNPAVLLDGKTALVLGYGEIGQRVAQICRGLGMQVMAVRRRPEKTEVDCPDSVHSFEVLDDLLYHANVIIICMPLTDETRGMIQEKEFKLLPPRSILVNIGRGDIVDEAALYNALKDGTLHAAGLDVWYNYPGNEAERATTLPSDFPFHELDNVVMSPHRGGSFGMPEAEYMRMEALASLLNIAAAGRPLSNKVDLGLGY